MDESDWTELDLDPEIPEETYALIGKIAVHWASFENDIQWQCVVEAQKDMLEDVPEKEVLNARIEVRYKAFARLRRARIGDVDGSRLDDLQGDVIAVARERARLLHGHIYSENSRLMVRHQPVKKGEPAHHVDIEPKDLSRLLERITDVRQQFDVITATHRAPNAHVS